MSTGTPLLQVRDLRVRYGEDVDALRGVSLDLDRGESLAVVGESGSGKSTLALCLAGLVQPPEAAGSVQLAGDELMGAAPETLRTLRWRTVAVALQGAPFNPVTTVGSQITEPLRVHLGLKDAEARARAEEVLEEVLLDRSALERYPHQLSGGERRRATLAMALTCDPRLVILDEPTQGLDLATANGLVERVGELAAERGFALLVISHDIPQAARLAERTVMLYAGEAMEDGDTSRVVAAPAHPYSWALLNTYPVLTTSKDLRPISGLPPDPRDVPVGCPFHPRCTQAESVCWEKHPDLLPSRGRLVACHFGGLKTLLSATDLTKTFRAGRRDVPALREVSLTVREGESVGVVGPSGSGKSTLAGIIAGHMNADSGEVQLEGRRVRASWRRGERAVNRRVQLVMQDPWDALSPRLTVEDLVAEPLQLAGQGDRAQRAAAVTGSLRHVGLPTSDSFLRAHVHELSGGQLQRIVLARALLADPKLLVADEPTSMLDASEQARLLVVLKERQVEMGLGLVFISHDMATVRKVADRLVVLDAGRVVEEGPTERVVPAPRSLTARRLLEAAPALPQEHDIDETNAPIHEGKQQCGEM